MKIKILALILGLMPLITHALDLINLNTADVAQLQQLKGIGKQKAEAIVQYRTQHGSFKNLSDVQKVSGISARLIELNKERLAVVVAKN